jgi:hypothetical protein
MHHGFRLLPRRRRWSVRIQPFQQVHHRREVPSPSATGGGCRRESSPPQLPEGCEHRPRGSSTTARRFSACRSAFRTMASLSGAPPRPARLRAAAPLGLPSLTPPPWRQPAPCLLVFMRGCRGWEVVSASIRAERDRQGAGPSPSGATQSALIRRGRMTRMDDDDLTLCRMRCFAGSSRP